MEFLKEVYRCLPLSFLQGRRGKEVRAIGTIRAGECRESTAFPDEGFGADFVSVKVYRLSCMERQSLRYVLEQGVILQGHFELWCTRWTKDLGIAERGGDKKR